MERPDFFELKNGEKVKLPFTDKEYNDRVSKLRSVMDQNGLDMVILTSMHNVAYYTGFIYCSFGRPYGCVITQNKISTISANIDASQPWRRSHCDNVIYTDWKRDNFLRAIVSIIGRDEPPKNIGIENDHVTLDMREKIGSIFTFSVFSDVSKDLMKLRMIKSNEEIEIIKNGARIADIGGEEIVNNIREGNTEIEVAIAGRDKMEREIAKNYPDAEYMDTWVWFQSGINTDGAHNPKTNRKLVKGDILSLNTFPMISGYYTGFIYCSFGRPYGCIITENKIVTISANIDASQPWRRSHCENIIYTDWKKDNFLKAITSIIDENKIPKNIGIENDHITLEMNEKIQSIFSASAFTDISKKLMKLRMIKSKEEIEIIKNGARIADIGGEEIVKNIKEGATELEIAITGRDKMEKEIAKTYPDAEYMDTWVWFQSGINTDGAHNPKTNRKLVNGDILSLNTFPMISGYYTALERTLFLDNVNDESLKAWEANVKVHKRGLELIKPGVKCSDICNELNELFAELGYLQYRTFGYGHSFGVLSHFYGREAGLELREDIDTILEENMVISMEPMILIPEGNPGAGGYREHDILVIGKNSAENITKFPFGPEHNVIKG